MPEIETRAAKTVALIAHDNKKDDMIVFVQRYRDVLERYALVATGTILVTPVDLQ